MHVFIVVRRSEYLWVLFNLSTIFYNTCVMHGEARKAAKEVSLTNSFVDISGVVDGCKRLSMEAADVDIIIHKSPDGDGINDTLTSPCVNVLHTNSSSIKNLDSLEKESSTCLEILQDISEIGEKPVHPEGKFYSFYAYIICYVIHVGKLFSAGSSRDDTIS